MGGFWEPHSSSVEFCEPNYFVSHYIAEFHNTWSSLLITLLAWIGFYHGRYPGREMRFTLLYIIVAIVGIGSALLHSTMHWFPQSSDEVPMLWASLAMLYCCFEMKTAKGKETFKGSSLAFLAFAALQTLIYYCFRSHYYIFVITFIASSLTIAIWTTWLVFEDSRPEVLQMRLQLWRIAVTTFIFIGGSVWIVDMNCCKALLPYYKSPPFMGITFHVLWHVMAGLGSYITIVFLSVVRLQTLQSEPYLEYIGGVIPVCRLKLKFTSS